MQTLNRCLVGGTLVAFVALLSVGELSPWRQEASAQHSSREPIELEGAIEHAIAVMIPIGESGVNGTVHFRKRGDRVLIEGKVAGLEPGQHGFHVHQYGDLSDRKSGKSAGDHFNPTGDPHGRHEDAKRHFGDLGNIEAGPNGEAIVKIEDDRLDLEGPFSILGRAVVVHSKPDQFTQPDGAAGERQAIGVIGIANPGTREFRQTRMRETENN